MKKFSKICTLLVCAAVLTGAFTSCFKLQFVNQPDEMDDPGPGVEAPDTIPDDVELPHSISGIITNKSGNTLSGVLVTLNKVDTTYTDGHGRYQFTDLPTGSYVLRAYKDPYMHERRNLVVNNHPDSANLVCDITLYLFGEVSYVPRDDDPWDGEGAFN